MQSRSGLIVLLAILTGIPQAGLGRGKPPKEPPEPTPVIQYAYVALPSLGGSRSGARAINDRGEVVGWSHTADEAQHAFFYTDRFTSQGDFVLYDLNTLISAPDCLLTTAHGINDFGQIAGDGIFHGQPRGYIYSPPTLVNAGIAPELVTFEVPGSGETYADDINDAGDVVGQYVAADGKWRFAIRFEDGLDSFVVPTDVPGSGSPAAMDASGSFASEIDSTDPSVGTQAFVFDVSTFQLSLLPLLGGPDAECSNWSEEKDMNASGQVTGRSSVGLVATGKKGKNAYECGGEHAFRYTPGADLEDLGTLNGVASVGEAINDAGDVAGRITMGFQEYHLFLYTDADLDEDGEGEGMIDISPGLLNVPTELVDSYLEIEGMNNDLVICGWSSTNGDAFLLIPAP